MKIDRILIDIFDWVRRLVFSRKNQAVSKPYERLESWRGTFGVLHKVKRDTPRAVDTYVFNPLRSGSAKAAPPKDIHICLDHLDALPGQQPQKRQTYTHRVTVLLASHWPLEDGSYDTSLLYSARWDFQGRSQYRDRWAVAITLDVSKLLKDRPSNTIDWEFEFIASAKQMMGASFRHEILDAAQKAQFHQETQAQMPPNRKASSSPKVPSNQRTQPTQRKVP